MDNTGCHPDELTTKYTNIKVLFLPPNTTSRLQPLDLGIINTTIADCSYDVLSKIDECENASAVVKSVNILIHVAIRWMATAWSQVREETIAKCFRKAGILNDSLDVITCPIMADDSHPFLEVDERLEIQSLIDKTMPTGKGCSVEEYLKGDNDLSVCTDFDSNTWDANFLSQLGQQGEDSEDDDEENNDEFPLPPLKIKTFEEAIKSLEDVQQFLESQGHTEEALSVGLSVDLKLQCASQTTISDYFHAHV